MRCILHSDINCFYAQVECLHNPRIRHKAVVVGGNEDIRHGIVLAKNEYAKHFNISTGETLYTARKKCPELVVVPPNYHLYSKFSHLARAIYYDYTSRVEPFGLDEAWLDVTHSLHLWSHDAHIIAQEISERMKAELGLTVSIGVSWNKIFAKFGSDYKKPDAITHITPQNYRKLVWESPVENLLYVGKATKRKLNACGIYTIRDLALTDTTYLQARFGKMGKILQDFALGYDNSEVKEFEQALFDVQRGMKSIGNGLTAPQDLYTATEVKSLVYNLAESVAQRLREAQLQAQTVSVSLRDAHSLTSYSCQQKLPCPTCSTMHIAQSAFNLIKTHEPLDGTHPLRSIHLCVTQLSARNNGAPSHLFDQDFCRNLKLEQLDDAVDSLRKRFGNTCIKRGIALADEKFSKLDIKEDNVIHPVSFFHV